MIHPTHLEAKARELVYKVWTEVRGSRLHANIAEILAALREVERETEKRVAERCAEIVRNSERRRDPGPIQRELRKCRDAIRAEFGGKP